MTEEIRTDNTDTFKNALNKIVELEEENGKLLQRIEQLEKDVTENESDCSMCDFPKLKQDLEKQIEKMKCWCNCGNYRDCLIKKVEEEDFKAKICLNCADWELKE